MILDIMNKLYIEDLDDFELEDLIDGVIINSKTLYDAKSRQKYLNIPCGFDIETTKIIVNENVKTAYCYHWQLGFGDYIIKGRRLDGMQKLFEMIISSIKSNKENYKLYIFDANLGYEWQFCKHYWRKMNITKLFAKSKRNPLEIEIGNAIVMREVLGLFGNSLAQIAKNYCGIKKLVGDLDYNETILSSTIMTDKEIGYCDRDVEILVTLAREYIYKNYLVKKGEGQIPYTATGIVRNRIKKELGKNLKSERNYIKECMPTKDEYELFRRYLFKGGICGSNIVKMNIIHENCVKGADITSDYPYQMLTKKFPMGKPIIVNNNQFMEDDKPYIAIIRFNKFKSKSTHALMSAHKALNKEELKGNKEINSCTILDNNRIQYAENIELVLNDIEFKSLKKVYKWKRAQVLKCWKFNDGYSILPSHMRKVCIEQYLKKEELKSSGKSETQEYRDAKAFVNSIFGMCATALFMEEWIYNDETCDIWIEEDENGNKITKDYEECCELLFLSPFWGFWITSYAREMLIDVISKFPRAIIQYDTDSVYYLTNTEQSEALEKYLKNKNRLMREKNNILFLGNEHMLSIGTWDFTETFKKFKALGSKRYMYESKKGIKVVLAGCRKSKKEGKEGISTLVLQCEDNNKKNGTNISPFEFFNKEGMLIDEEHSEKLCSLYVEDEIIVSKKDRDGNIEEIYCPSAIVLEPIPFKMTMGKVHKELFEIAVERYMQNSTERKVYDIWKSLKKSNI